ELPQLILGERELTEERLAFGEGRAREGAYGAPSVVIDRTVREHLEVLGVVLAGRASVVECVREAHALDGRLGHAANDGRRVDAERVEHGGYHVDRMGVLMPDLAFGLDPLGPVHQEGVGYAAAEGLAFPALERSVARVGPSPGVVVEIF